MADSALTFPELELVDTLIDCLEALIHEADETPLAIDSTMRPRRALYRILSATSPSDRKANFGDAIYLDSERMVLRCSNTEVVRLTPLEVMIQAEKSGRGETTAIIKGRARSPKRVRGGYEIEVEIAETRKIRVSPSQKLRESLHRNDSAAWNRWCQDIRDTIELMGMELQGADLSGYDLCCADLTGSDLTGANLTGAILAGAELSHCGLDGVTVAGTDFFRARMNRSQAQLLPLSGMPEVESVVYDS